MKMPTILVLRCNYISMIDFEKRRHEITQINTLR